MQHKFRLELQGRLLSQGYGQPEALGLDYQRNARFEEAQEAAPPAATGGE